MKIKKSWFTTVTLVALTVLMAVPALAERRTSRVSQGNNIGWTIQSGWGQPWTGGGRPLQFPTGSGNFIGNDGNTIGFGAYRDLDGDGTYEDTVGVNHIQRHFGSTIGYTLPAAAALHYNLTILVHNLQPISAAGSSGGPRGIAC